MALLEYLAHNIRFQKTQGGQDERRKIRGENSVKSKVLVCMATHEETTDTSTSWVKKGNLCQVQALSKGNGETLRISRSTRKSDFHSIKKTLVAGWKRSPKELPLTQIGKRK